MRLARERSARDLERIKYVAANYEHLQGLKKVPLGVALLAVVLGFGLSMIWTEVGGGMVPWPYVLAIVVVILALFVVGIVLPHFITLRYEQRYGTVQRYRPVPRRRMALYVTMVLALILGGSLLLLAVGVALVVAYWPERRFQGHHVLIGATAIGAFLAYAAGVGVHLATNGWAVGGAVFVLPALSPAIFIAAYLIVGGVLDHLLLARTMEVAPEEPDARTV